MIFWGLVMALFGSFRKKEKEVLSHADYNIIFDNKVVEDSKIELVNIGLLNVPTGQIVVCDPLVNPGAAPLTRKIPTGKYPVKIYVAKTEKYGDRYAIAKLEIKADKADKWVMALREGEKISELKEQGDYFGFPVDAGLGGFFDLRSGVEYNKFLDEFIKNNPGKNFYEDFFEAEFKKNSNKPNDFSDPDDIGDWVNYQFPGTDLNITIFHSGFGDGYYPAYWGIKNDGTVVSLVIDFHVLLVPEE